MAIVKMKKFKLFIFDENRENLINKFQKFNYVHIDESDFDEDNFSEDDFTRPRSSEDLIDSIENGKEIKTEKESTMEDDQIIKKNLDDAKNTSRDKDLDKSSLNLDSFKNLDKFEK
ncbi:MAG: hypothetical protein E6427_02890 [Anaerococcus sp.]|nr:hypothetical protein [Anaerococcus sp.]